MKRDLTKPELRRSCIQQRLDLTPHDWQDKSRQLCDHLKTHPLFQPAQTILAYFSFRQEPDLSTLYLKEGRQGRSMRNESNQLGETGTRSGWENAVMNRPSPLPSPSSPKTWGFPRCVGRALSWHLTPPEFPLRTGAYGIIEPHPNSPTLEPTQIDLILVPCVACDHQGYRLGYGGGFYDRLLSSPEWQGKPTIGIVFQFGVLPELVIDPWDQPLSSICTEAGWLSI